MAQKESKVIVMIALGSLFFWRPKGESSPFWSPFFIFRGILELQHLLLRHGSHGQDWVDKWARIEGDSIMETQDKSNYSEFLQGVFELIGVFAGNLSKFSD